MKAVDVSNTINLLTNEVINFIVEKTNGKLQTPIPFIEAYNSVIERISRSKKGYSMISNIEMRQYVREKLLKNDLMFINHEDVDYVFVTQKALDRYPL